jgi:hypothetical protein
VVPGPPGRDFLQDRGRPGGGLAERDQTERSGRDQLAAGGAPRRAAASRSDMGFRSWCSSNLEYFERGPAGSGNRESRPGRLRGRRAGVLGRARVLLPIAAGTRQEGLSATRLPFAGRSSTGRDRLGALGGGPSGGVLLLFEQRPRGSRALRRQRKSAAGGRLARGLEIFLGEVGIALRRHRRRHAASARRSDRGREVLGATPGIVSTSRDDLDSASLQLPEVPGRHHRAVRSRRRRTGPIAPPAAPRA